MLLKHFERRFFSNRRRVLTRFRAHNFDVRKFFCNGICKTADTLGGSVRTGDMSDHKNIAFASEHLPHAFRRQHPALIVVGGGKGNEMNGIETRINNGTRDL